MNRRQIFIADAPIKITGRLVDASNATMLAKVDDGADGIEVIYKPVAGERPLWDFPHGTLADREYAAYLLSSLGGFEVVPFTVLREGPFGPGAVQEWIEIDPEVDLIEFFQQDLPALRTMALFDAIVNNTDRKIGHILPTREGWVYGCDHGVTFHEEDKLRTVLWQWAGKSLNGDERELLEGLAQSLQSDLGQALGDFLTESEVGALKIRTARILDRNSFPEPSQDWPAVPWPPF